jgi:hypothetical protein
MKKMIIVLLLAVFVFSSCGTSNRNCDGGKRMKTEM